MVGVIGPALYMHKVFSSQQARPASHMTVGQTASPSAAEQQSAVTSQGQPAAGGGQSSPNVNLSQPAGESAPSSSPAVKQDNQAPGGASKEQSLAKPQGGASPFQPGANSSAAPEREAGCRVWVAVVGKNDAFLFKPGQVTIKPDNKWGITALGALDATGLPYATKPTWPDFVDAIGGQANYQMAGWMYSVNGEVPMHMASKHPVKTGDKVIWWYSRSMDQPPPRWEDLLSEK
ncbi:DUF4430 domain-containing protein [Moorella naiadis]|uniref:DUF4430 domain-containing protein n=1 Tax=Moorella naiadis (nom. illeg.) TaxID=3093670 RepID=UPI003D9C92A2